jgi:hypothetical protein
MSNMLNTAEAQKRHRRWFQFRLRTLLVAVMMWAVFCPFGVRLYRQWEVSRERAIIVEIHSLDGDSMKPYKERYPQSDLPATHDH